MTQRRPTFPRPPTPRSFARDNDFGPCEADACGRLARTQCPSCSGEYCLAHTSHPAHDQPAAPALAD